MTPRSREIWTHMAVFAALAVLGYVLWKPRAVAIFIETFGQFCF